MTQTRLEETSYLRADKFFEWTEFKFCTYKKGAYGPTKSECIDYYSVDYNFVEKPMLFDVLNDGFQTLTIPVSAQYKIELAAPGVSLKKKFPGVKIIGVFELKKGQKITVAL